MSKGTFCSKALSASAYICIEYMVLLVFKNAGCQNAGVGVILKVTGDPTKWGLRWGCYLKDRRSWKPGGGRRREMGTL